MAVRSRQMNTQATYWPPATADAEGKVTVSTGSLVSVRWQDKAEIFVDESGTEHTSAAVVYVAQEVARNGWLALGDQTAQDPKTLESARHIKAVQQSPHLTRDETLVKAMLQ